MTRYQTAVKCPYCHHAQSNTFELSDGEVECQQCSRPFELESYVERLCATHPLYPCRECGRLVKARGDGTVKYHTLPGKWDDCPGSQQPPAA